MIEKKQTKKNWQFMFLGANMDAISVAGTMGIKANRSVRFHSDSVGTAVNYNALSKAVSNYRRCEPSKASCEMALAGWDEEINEDFEARK